jgi:hypothetical protein
MLTALVVVGPVLTGCSDFDPDKLDVFNLNQKKKLPGERRELFPGGVPGVAQGVPPEYMKGYQPPPETADTLQAPPGSEAATGADLKKTASAEPAEEAGPKPKAKPKAKPRPRTASRPAAKPAGEAQQQQQQLEPWPGQQPQQAQQAQQSPWPTGSQQQPQQGQSPWPAPAQQQPSTNTPWPSAPPAGTFSKQ